MKKAYRYGVEIECLTTRYNVGAFNTWLQENHIAYGSDGSIRVEESDDYGIELKPGPLSFTDMAKILKKITEVTDRFGLKVNSSCGLHVHVSNKRFYKVRNLKRLLAFWASIEDVLLSTQPPSRINNQYCKRRLLDSVTRTMKLPVLKEALLDYVGQEDRYYALNIASLRRHGTVECRMHSASINNEKIVNWMILLTSIFNWVFEKYDKNIVEQLKNATMNQEKIIKVFKLLDLELLYTGYFQSRIQACTIAALEVQRKNAIKIGEITPILRSHEQQLRKLQDEISRLRTKVNTAQQAFTQGNYRSLIDNPGRFEVAS